MAVVRLRRRYNPHTREMEDIPLNAQREQTSAFVWDDLPGYESPVTGLYVEGRRQRRNDLAATNCRPWEGRDQEQKEANKARAQQEKKVDQLSEKMAHIAWNEAPERIRRQFRGK